MKLITVPGRNGKSAIVENIKKPQRHLSAVCDVQVVALYGSHTEIDPAEL